MEPRNPRDPLLLQVLPDAREYAPTPGFTSDAVGDLAASRGGGLLQKYATRALLVMHGRCAAHCRYCFRRHFPYADAGPAEWKVAVEHLRQSGDVDEIILSGGDPLTVSDERLRSLVRELDTMPQIRRLRIHTRLPILIPQRVTSSLISVFRSAPCQVYFVIHANHPHEIDETVILSCRQLIEAGIPVLNQAVLLAGINDNVEVMETLCRKLVDVGVLPYYLHQLDRVHGTAHFEVPISQGRELIQRLEERLPGYAVPKYVQEIPGNLSKTALR
jgi:EF-P beta-lysylation protein EpmB